MWYDITYMDIQFSLLTSAKFVRAVSCASKVKNENDASEIAFLMTLTSGTFPNQKANKQTSHE